jgi:hypothetical protein
MPESHQLERVEEGVYLNRWYGPLTLALLRESLMNRKALAQHYGDSHFVLITDFLHMSPGPIPSIPQTLNLLDDDHEVTAYVLLNLPESLRIVVPAARALGLSINTAVSYGEALEIARRRRAAHQQRQE